MRHPRKSILNRYAHTDDGKVIIDIAAPSIEGIYNTFDRIAPYSRKDLDGGIASYLRECVREIGSSPFVIRLSLSQTPSPPMVNWVQNSIYSFFHYLAVLEKRKIRTMLRTSLILLVVGLSLLVGITWMNRILPAGRGVLLGVLTEGLTVAAWVVMWESLASFLVRWFPRRKEIRLLYRIAHAPVLLATMEHPSPRQTAGVA